MKRRYVTPSASQDDDEAGDDDDAGSWEKGTSHERMVKKKIA